MRTLNHILTAGAFSAAALFCSMAQSQTALAPATSSSKAAAADMTDGEVRKIDKENMKITLKHGEIKNLDMPPMTMVFQVSDPALLAKVQPGDKVQFKASNEGGKLTVTELRPAK